MNSEFLLSNVARYCLQVGLLVGLAALIPSLLRLKAPAAKLAYWHILLAVCIALPLAAPWREMPLVAQSAMLGGVLGSVEAAAPAAPAPAFTLPHFSAVEIALGVMGLGAFIRLVWLGVGLWKLRRYRLASQPLVPLPSWSVEAELLVSEDVSSPVTFGLRRPVVLLPAGFHELDERVQDAVLAHECLHVRRRDWAITFLEELIRAAFWFHPAIWWLLGEIQLAREQAVDRAAVEITSAREEYVDALLAMAGASSKLDLAPAPLFLRKRHLKQRVVSLLKEANMSKTRLASALGAALLLMGAAGWVVTGALPLVAAPQTVIDAPGVTVDLGGATLLHRPSVDYPQPAAGVVSRGLVTVEVTTDAAGNVTDARVLSGPAELRKTVLQSVLQWHFARGSAGISRQVSVSFGVTRDGVVAADRSDGAPGVLGSILTVAPRPVAAGVLGAVPQPASGGGVIGSVNSAASVRGPLKTIEVNGLSEASKAEMLATLPVRVGDTISAADLTRINAAVRQFDEHLTISAILNTEGSTLTIQLPGSYAPRSAISISERMAAPAGTLDAATQRIRVGANVQAANILRKGQPIYPQLAKQAGVQGKVTLDAIIAADGTMRNLVVKEGHPLLVQAALDAARQWVYRPTMLNGNPVEVNTTIDINFTLSDPVPAPPVAQ